MHIHLSPLTNNMLAVMKIKHELLLEPPMSNLMYTQSHAFVKGN